MLVLFLLFPRLPGPLWSLPGDNSSAATGLSGSMSPGDITSLGMSDAIAFRVEFDGQVPAASELYWRGPVLTRFDGRRWTQRVGMARPVENTLELIGGISRYRVSLDAGANNWAFALDMPASWSVEERAAAIRMRSEYQLALFAPDGNSQRVPYSVTSYSDYRAREPLDADGIDYYRRLPEGRNPRARALVNSWLAESSDQDFLITQALDLFRADDFYYTLTPPPLGEHSVDEFLFETREGFCEHYASAFAVLMRMAGIPARVVTGYQGGERNGFGDYYIIRQSDAHAWTEVWSPAAGWRRVDPISAVAPERIALGSSRIDFREGATVVQRLGRITLMRQLALSWDAVNRVWNNWVIGYSPGLQLDLFEKLGFERPTRRQLLLLSAVAMALGMLALTLYFGFRLRRRRPQDPACVSFRHFTRKLRQAAIAPMQPGETPTAFASRAAAALPAAAGPIRSITDAYLAARYEPDADCIALRQLQRLVGEFRPGYVPASP
jgi:transglutaminase-like putative cysteine protease